MAKTISQRIAIEGGAEVIATIRGIGDEVKKAFGGAESSVKAAEGPVAQFRARLQEVEKQSYAFGLSLRKMADDAKDFGSKIGAAAKGVAVLGGALFAGAKATAAQGTEQFEGAQAAGLTTEAYGRLSFALKQNGVEAAQSRQLFVKLNDAAAGTSESAGKIRAAVQGLGISFTQLNGKGVNTEKVLGDIAEAFSKMPDGARKSAIATEIFGARVGSRLIPFLNEGRKGIKNLGDQAERLGIVFSGDAAKKADDFGDALDALLSSFAGLRNAFTGPFLEPFTAAMQGIAEGIGSILPEVKRVGTAISVGLVAAFNVVKAVVVPVFQAIMVALDGVAAAINKVFGTNITGKTILVVGGFTILLGLVVKLAIAFGTMFAFLGPLVKLFTGIPAILTAIVAGVKLLGSTFLALVKGVQLAITVLTGLNPIVLVIGAIIAAIALLIIYWPQISKAAIAAWNKISKGANDMWETIKGYWNAGVEFFMSLFTAEFWTKLWETAKTKAGEVWEFIKTKATEFKDWLMTTWVGSIVRAIDEVIKKAKEAWDWLQKAFGGSKDKSGASAGGTVAAARGGYIRGPGTSTSDSIPARLSTGEFVQRAKAVKYYGPGFMRALNNMRIPRPQGFSLGGLVTGVGERMSGIGPSPMRFAGGGMVEAPAAGGGRPVILQMPGGETFALSGPDNVVERLERHAGAASRSRLGRQPSWKDKR